MGAELSSLILEPAAAVGITALGVLAIMRENEGKKEKARWLSIGAVVSTIILIMIVIIVSVMGA